MDMKYIYRRGASFLGIDSIKESIDGRMRSLKDMYERLYRKIFSVLHSEKGQGIVEYVLIILLVSIVLVIALSSTGMNQAVSNAGSRIASSMQ